MRRNRYVINIGRLMREKAVDSNGRRMWVSPEAVDEWASRVVDRIDDFMPEVCRITENDGRRKILAEDVILCFGVVGRDVV